MKNYERYPVGFSRSGTAKVDSLALSLFFSKGMFFILTYSYYCCTIKEKGKGKSDKCQGEKSYQKLQI